MPRTDKNELQVRSILVLLKSASRRVECEVKHGRRVIFMRKQSTKY